MGQQGVKKPSLLGMILALLSGWFFATITLFAKFAEGVPAFEVAFLRSAVAVVIILPAALYFVDDSVFGPKDQRWWLCARAVIGVLGMALGIYAVKHMPIGDASVLLFMTPIVTGVISRLTLKEPWGWCQALASVISVIGVVFIAQPPFIFGHLHPSKRMNITEFPNARLLSNTTLLPPTLSKTDINVDHFDEHSPGRAFAVFMGVMSAVVMSCAYVLGRKVGQKVHFLAIGFTFSLAGLPTCGAISLLIEKPVWLLTSKAAWLMFGVGSVGIVAFCCLNKSLSLESAPLVALIRNVNVIIAYVYQVVLFGDPLTVYSGIGTVLILSSTVSVGWQKYRLEQRQAALDQTAKQDD